MYQLVYSRITGYLLVKLGKNVGVCHGQITGCTYLMLRFGFHVSDGICSVRLNVIDDLQDYEFVMSYSTCYMEPLTVVPEDKSLYIASQLTPPNTQ
jgi:hypothetical protein